MNLPLSREDLEGTKAVQKYTAASPTTIENLIAQARKAIELKEALEWSTSRQVVAMYVKNEFWTFDKLGKRISKGKTILEAVQNAMKKEAK